MTPERAKFLSENMDRVANQDRVFLNNPVVMQGLGLAPLVVADVSLQNALILAVAVTLLLTPTRILAGKLCQKGVSRPAHFALAYGIVSSVLYIGVYYLLSALFGSTLLQLGLYLPMLVVEPLIIKRHERKDQKERVRTALRKGLRTTLGYVLVLVLVGALRELLGAGTLLGFAVLQEGALPLAALPAGGFLLVGLLCAGWRGLVAAYKKHVNLEAKRSV